MEMLLPLSVNIKVYNEEIYTTQNIRGLPHLPRLLPRLLGLVAHVNPWQFVGGWVHVWQCGAYK